ncbi:MAG: hypothetical protein IIC29_06285, partial [Chloroflexi bacterium]|nr:hypothetical protein [Chloroflexota bacterium]
MERDEFKRQIGAISTGISLSDGAYAVWRGIRPFDERRKRLNRWKGFFVPVQQSLRQTILLGVARAYDGDGRTMSVRNLLKAAKNDPSLVPHADVSGLAAIEARLDAIETELEKLARLRNQQMAHTDAQPDTDDPLTDDEFHLVVSELKGILNDLSSAHDRSVTSWSKIIGDAERDTDLLIDELIIGTEE